MSAPQPSEERRERSEHDPARVREIAAWLSGGYGSVYLMEDDRELIADVLTAYADALPRLERLARLERVLDPHITAIALTRGDHRFRWLASLERVEGAQTHCYVAHHRGHGDTPLAAVLALADALAAQEGGDA